MLRTKEHKRIRRHLRIRKKVKGNKDRLRLCVHRSLKNIQAHLVDDQENRVIMGVSSLDKDIRSKEKNGGNIKAATLVGEAIARKATEKGIKKVAFDRGGYTYHGRVKAFADAVRKSGLEF